MRIQHFVKDITAAKRIFSNIEVVQNSANSAYYTIKNWNLMCTAFHELSGLSGFNAKYVNEIFKMGIEFSAATHTLVLEKGTYQRFNKLFEALQDMLETLIIMCEKFFPEDAEDQINVKLPDSMTLNEMADYIKEIDTVFNKLQAFKKLNENNDVTLTRVDVGSTWLILMFAVPAAITAVGHIIKLAMDVKRRLIEDDILKQRLRALKSGADAIENIEKELSAKFKEDCSAKAKAFNEERDLRLGNEEIQSLSLGIEKLAELMLKGVEIYASMDAPDSVKSAFPVQEAPNLMKAGLSLSDGADSENK